ncbi:hypothetical protein EAI30_21160 [Romboutsia ilealis]|nr:hypothetical protein [Romboutsia ilealis]
MAAPLPTAILTASTRTAPVSFLFPGFIESPLFQFPVNELPDLMQEFYSISYPFFLLLSP